MSKIIRAVRISGSVVTLGEAERELYLREGEGDDEESPIQLEQLLQQRATEERRLADERWQKRLQTEKGQLQAAADARLAEAEARWQAEREQLQRSRYDEGHQAGLDEREAEARSAVERLDGVLEAIRGERAQVLREAESTVVDLAVAIARRIVGAEVESGNRALRRVVHAALEHLRGESDLEIRVHPDDLQVARRFAQRWVERVARDTVLRVTASDKVDRGGCMIEGVEQSIDARLEGQLAVLHQALRAAVELPEAGSAAPAGEPPPGEGSTQ